MEKFEKFIEVRWADCDANRHVRHSTYYDYGAHARIRFFTEIGFDVQKLGQLHSRAYFIQRRMLFYPRASSNRHGSD